MRKGWTARGCQATLALVAAAQISLAATPPRPPSSDPTGAKALDAWPRIVWAAFRFPSAAIRFRLTVDSPRIATLTKLEGPIEGRLAYIARGRRRIDFKCAGTIPLRSTPARFLAVKEGRRLYLDLERPGKKSLAYRFPAPQRRRGRRRFLRRKRRGPFARARRKNLNRYMKRRKSPPRRFRKRLRRRLKRDLSVNRLIAPGRLRFAKRDGKASCLLTFDPETYLPVSLIVESHERSAVMKIDLFAWDQGHSVNVSMSKAGKSYEPFDADDVTTLLAFFAAPDRDPSDADREALEKKTAKGPEEGASLLWFLPSW